MGPRTFLAVVVALLTAASAAAQPGNPGNPADFIRNPHPAMPWAPNNPDRFASERYGTVIQYIPVPPQQVAIQVPAPVPNGGPTQNQETPGAPAQSQEGTGAPPRTQEQTVQIPGYYITETTTGYWYPDRWVLHQVSAGVYQWVMLRAEFRRK